MEAAEKGPIIQKSPIENQDLSFLHHNVGTLLAEYGWYLLFVVAGVYLLIQHLNKRRASRVQRSTEHEEVRDSTSMLQRREALEASRQRMQEELDAKAALFREKQQQIEEETRKQKIQQWENMKVGKSSKGNVQIAQTTEEASTSTAILKPKTDKKPLRNSGFNALTGEGGGACVWRPGRRGPSSGG